MTTARSQSATIQVRMRRGSAPIWPPEIGSILISEAQIQRRVRQLTREIQRDFLGRDLVIVSLLNGTVMFLADLIRHLSLPLRLDFIGVSSYGQGTESGDLIFTKEMLLAEPIERTPLRNEGE